MAEVAKPFSAGSAGFVHCVLGFIYHHLEKEKTGAVLVDCPPSGGLVYLEKGQVVGALLENLKGGHALRAIMTHSEIKGVKWLPNRELNLPNLILTKSQVTLIHEQQALAYEGGKLTPFTYGFELIHENESVTFAKSEIVIGRHPSCDWQLPYSSISNIHATVVIEEKRVQISDVSANGVFRNGRRVQIANLKDGDVFQLADFEIRYFLVKPSQG